MSKKDYELIASVIRYAEANYLNYTDALLLTKSFMEKLEEGNPRFDRVKFMEACGVL